MPPPPRATPHLTRYGEPSPFISNRVSIPPRKSWLDTSGGTKSAVSYAGNRLVPYLIGSASPPSPPILIDRHALIPPPLAANQNKRKNDIYQEHAPPPRANPFHHPWSQRLGSQQRQHGSFSLACFLFLFFACPRLILDFPGIGLVLSGQKKLLMTRRHANRAIPIPRVPKTPLLSPSLVRSPLSTHNSYP